MLEQRILRSAKVIAESCVTYRQGENVLIISDTTQSRKLSLALMKAFSELGANCETIIIKPREYPGQEPSQPVAELMRSVDIVISIPIGSITYSGAVQRAREAGTRFLIATGITEEHFCKLVPINYENLSNEAQKVADRLDRSHSFKISSALGTDLSVMLRGFGSLIIDGRIRKVGEMDYLPAGTVHTCPEEGTANGRIVIDGSLVPIGVLKEPVTLQVINGKVTDVTGKEEALKYREFLETFQDSNVYNFAEIGFGLNPNAAFCGLAIIDERIRGTAFVGIGRSLQIGGTVNAKTHTDGVIRNPTVTLDERMILDNGNLLI